MPTTSERGDRRIAYLHGFTQTHHSWHECASLVAGRLGGATTSLFPDLPGHGLSGGDRAGIAEGASELARLLDRSTLVGYSMGGRTALHVALAPGNDVERLVLLGATPGIADDDERRARVVADEQRAARIEAIGVDAFLDEWLAAPLFATLPPDGRSLDQRRRNTAAGLAHSLRTFGTGAQEPLWDRLTEIEIPVLVLAGELDTKFTAIGREMANALPEATFVTVAGAGHAAHAERPELVADAIATWLGRRD
jgi:2-succinyl-6-hydroxy-2,4-cyclohexadiene-1-carboxylate synthase